MADRFFVRRMLITMDYCFIKLVANECSGDRRSRMLYISRYRACNIGEIVFPNFKIRVDFFASTFALVYQYESVLQRAN
jgi:hypothetical protein